MSEQVLVADTGVSKVKHVVLVLSGKGGVGKSTVACQLARCFDQLGARTGLLDIDLCGPSVPKIMGMERQLVHTTTKGWLPAFVDPAHARFPVLSMGFLTDDPDAPIIWRGPKKNSIIKTFLEDVRWGELDVLVIDTPPGTSDEHISVCEYLHTFDPDGALLVTTPQNVSVTDVKKELSFCHKIGLPVLGVVENMSGYVCPHCTTCTNIFSSEGGRLLAQEAGIPFVGKIPIAPALCECEERGVNPLTVPEAAASLAPLMEFAKSFLAAPERARKPAADAATATAASS
eukprot:m51a1_g2591 putative Cfd1, nucleotide binding protein 2 (288) ;mRNA; r:431082-432057